MPGGDCALREPQGSEVFVPGLRMKLYRDACVDGLKKEEAKREDGAEVARLFQVRAALFLVALCSENRREGRLCGPPGVLFPMVGNTLGLCAVLTELSPPPAIRALSCSHLENMAHLTAHLSKSERATMAIGLHRYAFRL
ncbi:MAG: hypothetical protein ABSH41_11635 [Syntrophobacteraceae bacterium]